MVQMVSTNFGNVDLVGSFPFNAMVMCSHSNPAHIFVKKVVSDFVNFSFPNFAS